MVFYLSCFNIIQILRVLSFNDLTSSQCLYWPVDLPARSRTWQMFMSVGFLWLILNKLHKFWIICMFEDPKSPELLALPIFISVLTPFLLLWSGICLDVLLWSTLSSLLSSELHKSKSYLALTKEVFDLIPLDQVILLSYHCW